MSKTKFRSLGMGFLLAALILALVTVIWPFVPQSLKSQLDAVNLPIVSEGANEASYKAAYESLLAEKESGSKASTSSAKATSQASTTEAATTQSSKPVSITVEEGESSNDVADKLEKAGLVKSAKEFIDYLTTNNIACAGSFSGALGLSVEMITDETSESREYWQGVFGDLEGKDIEQHKLVNLAKQHDKKTKFFAWCGLEDFLFDSQDKAVADLKALGLDIDYRTDHGRHEWYYWEKQLEAYLEWLPIDYVKEERLS